MSDGAPDNLNLGTISFDVNTKPALAKMKQFRQEISTFLQRMKEAHQRMDRLEHELKEIGTRSKRAKREFKELNRELRKSAKDNKKLRKENKELKEQLDKTGNAAKKASGKFKIMSSSFMRVSITATAVTMALRQIYKAVKYVVKVNREFELSMSHVEAVTGAYGSKLQDVENKIRSVAQSSIRTGLEVARGAKQLGMAGFSTKEIKQALPGVIDLADAAALDTMRSAETQGDILNMYGLARDQASYVADVLVSAITSSNADIQDFIYSFQYAGGIMSSFGESVHSTAAALGTLADAGQKGSIAGTGLRKAYSSAIKPTRDYKRAVAEMGLSLEDLDLKSKSLIDVLETLQGVNVTENQLARLYGIRGAQQMRLLLQHLDKLKRKTDDYGDSMGAANKVADVMRDNLSGSEKILKSTWEDTMQSLEKIIKLTQTWRDVVESITLSVSKWNLDMKLKVAKTPEETHRAFAEFEQKKVDNIKYQMSSAGFLDETGEPHKDFVAISKILNRVDTGRGKRAAVGRFIKGGEYDTNLDMTPESIALFRSLQSQLNIAEGKVYDYKKTADRLEKERLDREYIKGVREKHGLEDKYFQGKRSLAEQYEKDHAEDLALSSFNRSVENLNFEPERLIERLRSAGIYPDAHYSPREYDAKTGKRTRKKQRILKLTHPTTGEILYEAGRERMPHSVVQSEYGRGYYLKSWELPLLDKEPPSFLSDIEWKGGFPLSDEHRDYLKRNYVDKYDFGEGKPSYSRLAAFARADQKDFSDPVGRSREIEDYAWRIKYGASNLNDQEKMKREKRLSEMHEDDRKLEEFYNNIGMTTEEFSKNMKSSFTSMMDGIFDKTKTFEQAITDSFDAMFKQILDKAYQKIFVDPLVGSLEKFFPSLSGGGFTGSGPRSGGLDGRGGFMAMLHPNETVIDHTRSGNTMGGVTVIQNMDFTNANDTTVAQLKQAIPVIAEAAAGKVRQEMAHGGDFYRFASGGR